MYNDGDLWNFMHTETFEQFPLGEETLEELKPYLKEGAGVEIEFFEGQPIGIEMPSSVELEVIETEPELKGATASNSPKPATLETGVVIQVPAFVRQGDMVRVDPTKGRYMERVK